VLSQAIITILNSINIHLQVVSEEIRKSKTLTAIYIRITLHKLKRHFQLKTRQVEIVHIAQSRSLREYKSNMRR